MRDNIKYKLKAIRNLANAESATQGERNNARVLYERLKAKYRLTDEDVSEVSLDWVEFFFNDDWEYRLITQVLAHVKNDSPETYIDRHSKRKARFAKLTLSEAKRARQEYEVFRKAWQIEIERCFRAFVQKNEIYSDHISDEKMTEKEEREVYEVLLRARLIKRTVVSAGLLTNSSHTEVKG
jgi:hypothetical protein